MIFFVFFSLLYICIIRGLNLYSTGYKVRTPSTPPEAKLFILLPHTQPSARGVRKNEVLSKVR